MNSLYSKVFEIHKIVDKQTEKITDNYGLLSGLAGEILFLYYYEKIYGKQQYLNIANKIDKLAESIEKFNSTPSFCSGMSGALYLIELLRQEGVVNIILDDDISNYINKAIQYYIQDNKYELLYGLTGVSQYLLLQPGKHMKQLLDIVDYFDESKIIIDSTYAWKKYSQKGNEIDLALSHGISSIIYFLSKMLNLVRSKKEKDKISTLIKKSCDFILSKKNILSENIYSYFPYSISLSNNLNLPNSRLAWCYGDLSIGITLFNAGKALNDEYLCNNGELILINAARNRKDLVQNLVIDPGICHGTSGVASIFYRMWWNTKNKIYLTAANYWINETLKMAKYKNGIAGYIYTKSNDVLTGYHLLEGVSGIALSILFISSLKEPIWDKCLMIS